MVEFKQVQIANIGVIVTGSTPSSVNPDMFGDIYPFITPSDMGADDRYVEVERRLSQKGYDSQYGRLLPQNSVCVVCIGATIGKICMTSTSSFTNQQVNSIVVNPKVADPFYVYYSMRTLGQTIKALAGGAATPIVNKTTFSGVMVPLPPLDVQRSIAGILSAYDDLIENNTRRIKLLEQTAHDLYREWFVEFRFPGHESVELVDSGTEFGAIPRGWEVVKLGKIAKMKYGVMPKKNQRVEKGYPIFSGYGVVGSCSTYHYVDRKITIVARGVGGAGNVVLSPKYAFVTNLSIVIHELHIAVRETFLFHRLNDTTLWSLRTGSAQAQVTIAHLNEYEIVLPPVSVQEEFEQIIQNIHDAKDNLEARNANLSETRDLLLPRLVSGELDVSDLDIQTERNHDSECV